LVVGGASMGPCRSIRREAPKRLRQDDRGLIARRPPFPIGERYQPIG
jgi:hypothetical protein